MPIPSQLQRCVVVKGHSRHKPALVEDNEPVARALASTRDWLERKKRSGLIRVGAVTWKNESTQIQSEDYATDYNCLFDK